MWRFGSPPSYGSTLITSAPWSAIIMVRCGPGRKSESSTTLTPESFMGSSPGSERELRPELDHPVGRELEVLDRARTVPLHPAEELAAPGEEARSLGAGDRRLAEEERGLVALEAQAVAREERERAH